MQIFLSGSTSDLGTSMADYLASRHHSLYLTSRSNLDLGAQANRLEEKFKRNTPFQAVDLSDLSEIEALKLRFNQEKVALDGCVIIYPRIDKPKEVFPSEDIWIKNFRLCFLRPLLLLETALQFTRDGGKVVIVSGIASTLAFPDLAMTNAIRSAWLAQVKTLSYHLGRRNICINTVSLGALNTPRIQKKMKELEDEGRKNEREDHSNALGRLGELASVNKLIESLLGEASNHLTGSNLRCDGGFTRHY